MVKMNKYAAGLLAGSILCTSLSGCTQPIGVAKSKISSSSEAINTTLTNEQKEAVKDIDHKIQLMYDVGANLKLIMSDDGSEDWILMFNKDKQCYAEMTYGSVIYTPGGNTTLFSSTVKRDHDIDILTVMNNMLRLVEQGTATIDISKVKSNDSIDKETEIETETETVNEYIITVKGLNNIKKIYSMTMSDEDTEAVITNTLATNLANKESKKDEYEYILRINTSGTDKIGATLELKLDGIDYVGWQFNGYIPIGNWSLPEKWEVEHTEEEWVKLYNELKENIKNTIDTYAKDNFTEEQIKDMEQSITIEETAQVTGTNTMLETGSSEFQPSINRESSFNDTVQSLLKEDGISEESIDTFEVPEGYTTEDKEKMVSLYNVIKEWDKDQVTGVLVSPIEMSDINFIKEYIKACEKGYSEDMKSAEVDKYGTIFWEDTLGTFINMIR